MILEQNPDGITMKRVSDDTGLAYATIKKKLEDWGFEIRKETVLIKKKVYVIFKKKVNVIS